jgi:hypothetical protein
MSLANLFLVRFPTVLSYLNGCSYDEFDPNDVLTGCIEGIKATIEDYQAENWRFSFERPDGIEASIQDLYKLLFWINQNEGVAKMQAQQWYLEEKAEAMKHVPEERERECHHLGWYDAVSDEGPGYVW